MKYGLWVVQGLLAALFLVAGVLKLTLPLHELTRQVPVPGMFLRLVGVVEVLGAAGLVLPGLLRTRQRLTLLAAAMLAVLMVGATGVTLVAAGATAALMPVAVGLAAAFVCGGRWRLQTGAHETARDLDRERPLAAVGGRA